jgi:nicotinamidase-related amidase
MLAEPAQHKNQLIIANKWARSENEAIFPVINPTKDSFGRLAVLVVDMQNDFLARGAPIELPRGRKIVPRVGKLLQSARNYGYPVLHIVTEHRKDGFDLENLERMRNQIHCVKGSHGARIVEGLHADGDIIVIKKRYSGFFQTPLDTLLRRMRVGILVLVGVATNGCVLATALDAYFRDYWIIVPSDCVEAETSTLHRAGLSIINYLVGLTPPSSSVIRFFHHYQKHEVDIVDFLVNGRLTKSKAGSIRPR